MISTSRAVEWLKVISKALTSEKINLSGVKGLVSLESSLVSLARPVEENLYCLFESLVILMRTVAAVRCPVAKCL